jgi:5'-nucleotidase
MRYGAVYEVLPFDNRVATLQVTGEELLRVLTAAYGSKKGVFQVSGLEVQLGRCPAADRLKKATLPGGRPLERARRYTVVMPDFLARGGDGLGPALATLAPSQIDFGDTRDATLRDELVAWWQAQKAPLRPPRLGRIAFQANGAPCRTPESWRP